MIQYAAFGWATLTWWSWPLLFLVTMTAVYVAVRLAFRGETEPDGPVPCLAHLGTEPDGIEWWCMLRLGHDGTHLNQWGVDPSEDIDETWEDEEPVVPVSPVLCTWGENGSGNESACWKMAGHDGPHMFLDQ